ncbi:phage head morphogenesis protein [Budviciaceae bacterium CWB-B4]|uniref:Phage head morphogenesis protein n=1 Tax=Limnobaculum xujianqingii TaxID=2738837 RepID=A0A9D7FZ13_9GAMM|nr:phage minor head protein [Limnobaculum xujianqingii]MBK5074609.1 phage head morphogenesis protein [Limnobaculum xujianqingii]MBK5177725.1 phage head morphogenesis protein [Limnobaculum xujianqingii]
MKAPKSAILPRNKQDPTGADSLERRAIKDFARRIKAVGKVYIDALNRFPKSPAVNRRYEYQLDPLILAMILEDASLLVDAVLLEGGQNNLWFSEDYIAPASARGTSQTFVNLSQQSAAYAAGRESLQAILLSLPCQRRLSLLFAREFEEMKGLSADIKRDMARILTDGLGRGLHPDIVARNLRKQIGIEIRRANRIARTEITYALRKARWEEAEIAIVELGLKIMLLHFSALSPTTRVNHALRHGHLYTIAEVQEWYSIGANAINCKCAQVEILVDNKGKPLNSKVIDKAKKEFETEWNRFTVNKSICQCCLAA